jgi:hypothetical protein
MYLNKVRLEQGKHTITGAPRESTIMMMICMGFHVASDSDVEGGSSMPCQIVSSTSPLPMNLKCIAETLKHHANSSLADIFTYQTSWKWLAYEKR